MKILYNGSIQGGTVQSIKAEKLETNLRFNVAITHEKNLPTILSIDLDPKNWKKNLVKKVSQKILTDVKDAKKKKLEQKKIKVFCKKFSIATPSETQDKTLICARDGTYLILDAERTALKFKDSFFKLTFCPDYVHLNSDVAILASINDKEMRCIDLNNAQERLVPLNMGTPPKIVKVFENTIMIGYSNKIEIRTRKEIDCSENQTCQANCGNEVIDIFPFSETNFVSSHTGGYIVEWEWKESESQWTQVNVTLGCDRQTKVHKVGTDLILMTHELYRRMKVKPDGTYVDDTSRSLDRLKIKLIKPLITSHTITSEEKLFLAASDGKDLIIYNFDN